MVKTEKAIFAAGCFWGVEEEFRRIDGVISTRVGYIGGKIESPSYKDVCSDRTGHAEAVEITYDPEKVTYDKLLERFWSVHNPSALNRQGLDIGTQYRSAIFYSSPKQKSAAEKSKIALEKSGKYRQVVTDIVRACKFYEAEDYHQQYLEKRGLANCHL